ncbi:hypothetical protein PENSPDRAFT_645956, partial [Peniophora sp. CONT]
MISFPSALSNSSRCMTCRVLCRGASRVRRDAQRAGALGAHLRKTRLLSLTTTIPVLAQDCLSVAFATSPPDPFKSTSHDKPWPEGSIIFDMLVVSLLICAASFASSNFDGFFMDPGLPVSVDG